MYPVTKTVQNYYFFFKWQTKWKKKINKMLCFGKKFVILYSNCNLHFT